MNAESFFQLYAVYKDCFPGLSDDPRQMLAVLERCAEAPVTQAELARLLGVHQPAVSKIEHKLLAAGLVEFVAGRNAPKRLRISTIGRRTVAKFETALERLFSSRAAKTSRFRVADKKSMSIADRCMAKKIALDAKSGQRHLPL